MHADEYDLIEAARRGELRAATEVVDRHYGAVFGFLRRLTGNEDEAADLTQRTFSRVWRALARYAGRSSVRSWLHGIAYHVYLDWRRADHRLERQTDAWWEQVADERAGPDRVAAEADLAAMLYAAVDQLDPDLRATVHLHHYQGLTLEETAASLGVASSTVKYRLRGALEQLQRRLEEEPTGPRRFTITRKP